MRGWCAPGFAAVKFKTDAPDLVSDLPGGVFRAMVEDQGIFYRVWFGAFTDKSGATALCDAITSRGADCFVRKSRLGSAAQMMREQQAALE